MARAPFQVLVLPYRLTPPDLIEYALFKRSDEAYWQGIAGGGADTETPLEAARREAWEEAGISMASAFLVLDTRTAIPVISFAERAHWGRDVWVIPEYCFGVAVTAPTFLLSSEHTEYQWMGYQAALARLHRDSNKTALWELNARLTSSQTSSA